MDVYERFCSALTHGFHDQRRSFAASFQSIHDELVSLRKFASTADHLAKENTKLRSKLELAATENYVQPAPPIIGLQSPTFFETNTELQVTGVEVPDALRVLIEKTPRLREYLVAQALNYAKLEKAHLKLLDKTRRLQSYVQSQTVYDDKERTELLGQRTPITEVPCRKSARESSVLACDTTDSQLNLLPISTRNSPVDSILQAPRSSIARNSFHGSQDKEHPILLRGACLTDLESCLVPALEETRSSNPNPLISVSESTKRPVEIAVTSAIGQEKDSEIIPEYYIGRKRRVTCIDDRREYRNSPVGLSRELSKFRNRHMPDSFATSVTPRTVTTTLDSIDLDAIEVPFSIPSKRQCLDNNLGLDGQGLSRGRLPNTIETELCNLQPVLSQGQSLPALMAVNQDSFRLRNNFGSTLILQPDTQNPSNSRDHLESRLKRRLQHNKEEHARRYGYFGNRRPFEAVQSPGFDINTFWYNAQDNKSKSLETCDSLVSNELSENRIKGRLIFHPKTGNSRVAKYTSCDFVKAEGSAKIDKLICLHDDECQQAKAIDLFRSRASTKTNERLNKLPVNLSQDDTSLSRKMISKKAIVGNCTLPSTSTDLNSFREGYHRSKSQNIISLPAMQSSSFENETISDLFRQQSSDNHVCNNKIVTNVDVNPTKSGCLRDKPLQQLSLDDFVANSSTNQGLDFAFTEVIRSKDQRQLLPACLQSGCCGEMIQKLADFGAIPDASEHHGTRCTPVVKAFAQQHGTHRVQHTRGASPPGFWRADMPTTQEEQCEKELSFEMERKEIEHRYKEALCNGGRWKFKDECGTLPGT